MTEQESSSPQGLVIRVGHDDGNPAEFCKPEIRGVPIFRSRRAMGCPVAARRLLFGGGAHDWLMSGLAAGEEGGAGKQGLGRFAPAKRDGLKRSDNPAGKRLADWIKWKYGKHG